MPPENLCGSPANFGAVDGLLMGLKTTANGQLAGLTPRWRRPDLEVSGEPGRTGQLLSLMRWRKLVWNMAFNGLCTVSGKTTLEVLEDSQLRKRLLAVMAEVITTTTTDGADLEPNLIAAHLPTTKTMPARVPLPHGGPPWGGHAQNHSAPAGAGEAHWGFSQPALTGAKEGPTPATAAPPVGFRAAADDGRPTRSAGWSGRANSPPAMPRPSSQGQADTPRRTFHGGGLPLATVLRAALPLAAVTLAAPAQAGSLSGTAQLQRPLPLPPDAVFEAVLLDAALADAPARELGRFQQQPAGQPPFRFTIPYRDSDLAPGGRYAVRASVRQCEQLLFTTDSFHPVLTGGPSLPLRLQLVPVGTGRPVGSGGPGPMGCLPASWRGDLPNGADTIRWQVDLAADGTFQMRQALLNQPAPNSFDDIGRWRLEPESLRLVLRGGRKAPVLFKPVEKGRVLRKLDLEGRPSRSGSNDHLRRLAQWKPIDPRLHLLGLFRHLADAPSLELCATGHRLPVAMEGDYLRLERAYLGALPPGKAGQPLLVKLEGLITQRPSMEPWQGPVRTVVVERFGGVHPGRGCPR